MWAHAHLEKRAPREQSEIVVSGWSSGCKRHDRGSVDKRSSTAERLSIHRNADGASLSRVCVVEPEGGWV